MLRIRLENQQHTGDLLGVDILHQGPDKSLRFSVSGKHHRFARASSDPSFGSWALAGALQVVLEPPILLRGDFVFAEPGEMAGEPSTKGSFCMTMLKIYQRVRFEKEIGILTDSIH